MKRFITATLVAVGTDQATKAWVRATLPLGHRVPLAGGFALWHITNPGITLGLGRAYPAVWLALGAVAAVAVVAVRSWLRMGPVSDWIFGLVLGGAVGNLLDRALFGQVTDFLKVPLWPGIMNGADIFLRLGIVALAVLALRRRLLADPRPRVEAEVS